LHGTLTITSRPEWGTTLMVKIPLHQKETLAP